METYGGCKEKKRNNILDYQITMKKFYNSFLQHNAAFWIFGGVSIILLVVSFFLPPMGAVTPSAMEAVAELFAFASLGAVYKAIDNGTSATITHGGTTVTVNKDEEDVEDGDVL